MTPGNGRPLSLAQRLRKLRESHWPDVHVTQASLAKALAVDDKDKIASSTVSAWEHPSHPKTPPVARLEAYARFFATRRSLIGGAHVLPDHEFQDEEREQFEALRDDLLRLHSDVSNNTVERDDESRRALLYFDDAGPIVIICPEAPDDTQGPLANEDDPNYTRLHRYADLDALIEMFGHIRALNPTRQVLHRLPSDVQQVELQNHLVLLGGVAWNSTTRRILAELRKLPIEQVEDVSLTTGEVFRVKKAVDPQEPTYGPNIEEIDGKSELIEDLALLARLPNPFNSSRTLTICNGVHSSGVLGAALIVTDETVRPNNEKYLARRFPASAFAMLVKVPVVSGKVLAPDLQNPDLRVFEWSPESAPTEE